jgi:hypothetical protein
MRTVLLAAALFVVPSVALAQVYVNPYMRRDGTMVQGHFKSLPDGNPYNNYSYPGSMNPYTGRVAPGNSDAYLRQYNNGGNGGSGYGYGSRIYGR